ncbi:hypothetical protein Q5P01_008910 [Channa striata]|uniref:Rab-GAP TBC domain-containing protein n=1 Tax=Channa striata TaxID=64152 RepID=A0AA88SS26_CHASR|nr:hypothetical protein Q5P01_008910 [Channa striata]
MLSPSSPTQKNLSEGDSSGSDAGSEVSLEPETDRFGFIVTNGSTAGCVGPPPELVRQREAKWINIIQQWDRIWSKKTSKVKVQCQKGIPASLRAKCWPLLCGASDRMKQNENLYQNLDLQPALQSWVDVIERDLDRQFPFHEMFLSKDGHGQRGLFRVLKAYTQYQPEEGYCQAQGPVAAVLLMNMPTEEAFWCLVQISEQYLPGYYSPLLEGVLFDAAMLNWVLKRTCPAAHKHLQHHGVEPLMFATDWLMCLFTRHLPFNTLLRVWDLFFCYGVRVLLQVAVVLVRRVLGRAEQRKQCQGQMETLEKLRGIREQVQEEDDAFIAEVCSVPLSARDLEKRTEKELEKWRKDKPSSNFDPRGRCHGYHMAWTRAQHNKKEQERKEREKGNLSVPIARSSSTLSLSPSLLHKKLKKGGKASAGEGERGGKVVRHLSMGAKDEWRSWTDLNFEKVQGVQEEDDVNSEEQKKQKELQLTGQTKERELVEEPIKTDKIQNIPAVYIEETVTEQNEEVETTITEKEESEIISQQAEETNVETEQNQSAVKDQTTENILPIQPPENISQLEKEEEPDPCSHPQVEEEENHQGPDLENGAKDKVEEEQNIQGQDLESGAKDKVEEEQNIQGQDLESGAKDKVEEEQNQQGQDQENEVKDTDEETEKQVEEECEHTAAVQEKLIEIHKHEDADTNTEEEIQVGANSSVEHMVQNDIKTQEGSETKSVQQRQVYTESLETRTETCPESETESNAEAPYYPDPETEAETQQQQEDAIKETDTSSHGGVIEVKYHSTESLAEVETTEEIHTQTDPDTNVLAQHQEMADENAATQEEVEAEMRRIDIEDINSKSETEEEEAEPLPSSSPECIQQEDTDLGTRAETEEKITAPQDTVTESDEAFPPFSEKDCDTEAHEFRQEKAETALKVHSGEEVDSDHKQAEETPTETNTKVENNDSVEPERKEEEEKMTNNSEQRTSSVDISVEISATEEPVCEQPTTNVTVESSDIQENNVEEDDVFISPHDMTDDPNSDSSPQAQITDCSQVEPNNNGLTQTSGQRSSRSSGDVCVRRSSTSRGSRLARRLSEDLFITPQKSNQSQSIPNHPDLQNTESQSNPGITNPSQTPPDVTQSTEVKPSPNVPEETEAQQEPAAPPKRFGLFRRLRGDQAKKAKEKGTQKMQVPKILIQDFSDGTGKQVEEVEEEKLSSRERRKRRRERERREKDEERLRKKKEKELEKEKERERRKPQTRGKSFQVQKEKGSEDVPFYTKTGPKTRFSASYAESYF